MDDWNRNQHGRSGLSARVRASAIDAASAERETLRFLEAWAEPGRSPMCGNSICQDRRFLARHMPALETIFSLSEPRREHAQGTGAALGAAGGGGLSQGLHPPGAWTMCASRSASCSTTASTCCARCSAAAVRRAYRPRETSRSRPRCRDSVTGCRCPVRPASAPAPDDRRGLVRKFRRTFPGACRP